MADTATDRIGLDYRINLAKLADTIRKAKRQLKSFHKDLAGLSKMASITITVNDAAAKKKVRQFKNAIQATLDKHGQLQIKEVGQPFGKIGGAVPRMTKDFDKLYTAMGRDSARLGELNTVFNKVNRSIAKQSLEMTARKKNGERFYKTANRERMALQHLNKTIVATSTGFKNNVADQQKAIKVRSHAMRQQIQQQKALEVFTGWKNQEAQAIKTAAKAQGSATASLRQMGVTSATTNKQFEKMNFTVADHDKIAQLTRRQIGQLRNEMASGGKATAEQSHQFNRLNKRLEHSSYQVRKQTSAMGDARRAQERWGAGFKYMMLSQAAWIASGAVIFGTLGAITQALRDFLDFNQGLVDAAAITQATASGYKRMEVAAMKAFKSSTMGAKEATDALKILGQAGMDATDAAIALETVYKVTTATGGSTTEVVKFLTTAINVWKLSAEEAAKVGNILGAALNYSKLEVEDLGVTFNYVASMAKSTGMSITDLAATMAVMANAGIKASTIGTGLRGVMSKLLSGSGKLNKELEKLEAKDGVKLTFEDISLSSNTLMESLEKLAKAGFDLKNIFTGLRRREAAALNVMLEQGVERFNLMAEALKDTTAIEVMFERSMKGMKNQLILTGHQIQAVLIDALKVSQPIIIGITSSIQALTTALRDLAPILISVGIASVGWKIAMGLLAIKAADLTKGITKLSKVLMFLKTHWIFTGLALLVAGYTAVKAIIDATTVSYEEQISQLNTEIDDIRKLNILLTDSNRTNEEKLRILADYSKDYPTLLKFLDQEKIKVGDVTEAMIKGNEVRKETKIKLKEEELARLQEQLWATEEAYGEGYEPTKWEKFFRVAGKSASELTNKIRLLNFEIAMLKGEEPEIFTDPKFYEMTVKAREALEKLRYDQSTATEQAKKDYIDRLSVFRITEENKTKKLEKELKNRSEARAKYMAAEEILGVIKIEKGEESEEYKAQETITINLKHEWERRKSAYAELLEAMKRLLRKYNETVSEIEEDAESKRQALKDKALKDIEKRVDDRKKAEDKAIKTSEKLDEDYVKFKAGLTKKLIDTEEDGHEKQIKLWQLEVAARKKQYADMLKAAESYYDELMEKAEENPVFVSQAVQVMMLIKRIKELENELDILAEKTKPTKEDIYDPSDFATGMAEGWGRFTEALADECKTWEELIYDAGMAMRDTLSDVFFDSMMGELKSASDYWKAFTTTVKRLIAEIAAKWLLLQASTGISWFANLFPSSHEGGLIKAHEGGLINASQIKKMHSGGLASNETLRVLKDNEFVIKDSSTRSIGAAALNYQNDTGRLPPSGPQQVIHKYYNYIYAIDSESMDMALRKRGAGAISDISLNANAYARGRQDLRVSGRGRY